jgi:hypothetical protein
MRMMTSGCEGDSFVGQILPGIGERVLAFYSAESYSHADFLRSLAKMSR